VPVIHPPDHRPQQVLVHAHQVDLACEVTCRAVHM
jgi:hypothetical protein